MIMNLTHAYIIAAQRAHMSRLAIHIYFASDANYNGGYVLISDLHLPLLSKEYDVFEHIDTVYPETNITATKDYIHDF